MQRHHFWVLQMIFKQICFNKGYSWIEGFPATAWAARCNIYYRHGSTGEFLETKLGHLEEHCGWVRLGKIILYII